MENEYFKLAIRAALSAGKEIIKVYKETETEIEFKEDCSPLTLADLTSNQVINDHLLPTNISNLRSGNVTLGYGAHVGTNATIRENINIGDFSITGSGSVVLNDVPKNSIYIGNPARLLKKK